MKMEKAHSQLRLDLLSLEATYLVTSSAGPTSRNRLARAPHPLPTPPQESAGGACPLTS